MKEHTTVLPVLLSKLEVIRQVLEAQGVSSDDADDEDGGNTNNMVWTWQRGHIQMEVRVALLDQYTMFSLAATSDRNDCVDVTWGLELPGDHWSIREWSPHTEPSAFEELKNELRTRGLCPVAGTKDDFSVSEPQAREAVGMLCAFFAKQPVDAPAEAAVTTTP